MPHTTPVDGNIIKKPQTAKAYTDALYLMRLTRFSNSSALSQPAPEQQRLDVPLFNCSDLNLQLIANFVCLPGAGQEVYRRKTFHNLSHKNSCLLMLEQW